MSRREFAELASLVREVVVHSTGRRDLPIVRLLDWLGSVSGVLREPVTLARLRDLVAAARPAGGLIARPVWVARHLLRDAVSLLAGLPEPPPPPPLIEEVVDEFDALLKGLSSELMRHVMVLEQLIQYAPALVEGLVETDYGQLRGTLGEALCVWWASRVLREVESGLWGWVRGPLRIAGVEVDVLSVKRVGGEAVLSVAEVKNSRPGGEGFKLLPKQLAREAKQVVEGISRHPTLLKQARLPLPHGVTCFRIGALAVITLNRLGAEFKERLREGVAAEARAAGLPLLNGLSVEEAVRVYDAGDILEMLRRWRYKGKDRYVKLFEAVANAITCGEA